MNYTTPGVFIREEDRFPQGVVAVSTSTPVFLGFTYNGDFATPMKVTSYSEFIAHFGDKHATKFSVQLDTGKVKSVFANYRYFLHDSVDLFFKNGGSSCYIIRVDNFVKPYSAAKTNAAIEAIELTEDASTICFPDLYCKKKIGSGNTQTMSNIYGNQVATRSSELINLAGKLKDKFCLFDAEETTNDSDADATDVRGTITPTSAVNNKYGAVYYPWINKTLDASIGFADITVPAAITSTVELVALRRMLTNLNLLDTAYDGETPTAEFMAVELQQTYNTYDSASTPAAKKSSFRNFLTFAFEAVIALSNFEDALGTTHAVLDVDEQSILDAIHHDVDFKTQVRALARFHHLLNGTAVLASTNTFLQAIGGINAKWFNIGSGTDTLATVQVDTAILADLTVDISTTAPVAADVPKYATAVQEETYFSITTVLRGLTKVYQELDRFARERETTLFAQHPQFAVIRKQANAYLKQVPTQGAIAGLYATNDAQQGVWHAPANMSVQGIEGTVKAINNATQGRLNIDPDTGKSINVLREFTGKGTLVWGARTLAGNSNEWAYVPVRRYFSFVEKSLELAIQPYLFRSNDASTWVQTKAMVTSFLINQWQQGALQGASFEDAFFVKIGLGETMSEDDIRNGEMKIQLGLAVVRPAEFIVITFSHKTLSTNL